MSAPARSSLNRLAIAAELLGKRQQFCQEFEAGLATLTRSPLPSEGLANRLVPWKKLLTQAAASLDELKQAGDDQQVEAHLANLEQMLEDGAWAESKPAFDQLQSAIRDYQGWLLDLRANLAQWEKRRDMLNQRFARAQREQLPVAYEARTIKNMQEGIERALTAMRLENYTDVDRELTKLAKQTSLDLVKRFEQLESELAPYKGQADLHLLCSRLRHLSLGFASTKAKRRTYEYTVTLRSSSRKESHGFNLKGTRIVNLQAYDRIRQRLGQIQGPINSILHRSFQAAQGTTPDPTPTTQEPANPATPPQLGEARRYGPPGAEGALGPSALEEELQDIGSEIFRQFLPEPMQRYLETKQHTVTLVTNDQVLPWELMHFNNQFLCLDRPVSRVPLGELTPRELRAGLTLSGESTRREAGKPNFLLIYSDPDGSLKLARREVEAIEKGLKDRNLGDSVRTTVLSTAEATSGGNLTRILRSGAYDVIHYAGHGSFDRKTPRLSGLLLAEYEVLFAETIRNLLEGRPVVFLNACETGITANGDRPQEVRGYLQEQAEGLASAFIYGGAIACIGTLWPVFDGPAAEFAIEFYTHLFRGGSVGESLRQARLRMKKDHPEQITWAAYVLYGDPRHCVVE